MKYEIVARNKDLEELGLKPDEYYINWCSAKDTRHSVWEKEQKEYGFDNRETWNFDILLIEYIYTHLKMYLRVASNIIDLAYYTFTINNEDFTLEELIKMVCADCANAIKKYNEECTLPDMSNTFSILAKILPHLWW